MYFGIRNRSGKMLFFWGFFQDSWNTAGCSIDLTLITLLTCRLGSLCSCASAKFFRHATIFLAQERRGCWFDATPSEVLVVMLEDTSGRGS